jgi:hypothetical protein
MGTTYAPCVGGRKEYKGYKIIFQHLFKISDENRIRDGGFGARAEIGNLRVFDPLSVFHTQTHGEDGQGWEHVSVSLPNRCPN